MDRLLTTDSLLLFDSMSSGERLLIEELIFFQWHHHLGSFYVKSLVLKLVTDYFHELLLERKFKCLPQQNMPIQARNYLLKHITKIFPDVTDIVRSLSTSQSTLSRQFKKLYGVPMSVFFIQKKMEYARKLMLTTGCTLKQAAGLVGYRSSINLSRCIKNILLQEYKDLLSTLNNTTLLNKALALLQITIIQYFYEESLMINTYKRNGSTSRRW